MTAGRRFVEAGRFLGWVAMGWMPTVALVSAQALPSAGAAEMQASPDHGNAVMQSSTSAVDGTPAPVSTRPPEPGPPEQPKALPSVDAPKVAVILAGDADLALRARADAALSTLRSSSLFVLPSDALLARALLGESPSAEIASQDGFEELRSRRRQLGWGEERDVPLLTAIGRQVGAIALLVVRRGDNGIEAVVFSVKAAAFFEGSLALASTGPTASDAELLNFVRARAVAPATAPPAAVHPKAVAKAATPSQAPAPKALPQKSWGRRNWPYLVAGALLAAALTAFLLKK